MTQPIGSHCLSCGFEWWPPVTPCYGHWSPLCAGRVIPIATLCSEPSVIDAGDLAPGMVMLVVDCQDHAMFTTPDARLVDEYCWAQRLTQAWFDDPTSLRFVAEGVFS